MLKLIFLAVPEKCDTCKYHSPKAYIQGTDKLLFLCHSCLKDLYESLVKHKDQFKDA